MLNYMILICKNIKRITKKLHYIIMKKNSSIKLISIMIKELKFKYLHVKRFLKLILK